MAETADTAITNEEQGETRRDFLLISTATVGAVGAALAAWPFIDSMNPAADTLALAETDVDLSAIEEGQSITVIWRGKPVFIRRRTEEEIEQARVVKIGDLPDPQADEDRVQKDEWLVMVGICTHLGCIPLGQKEGDNKGAYGGWVCPCHGSHYDACGRIRKGPAPLNLEVPEYEFVKDDLMTVG